MTEHSIIGARASVMVYDDAQKKWLPSGTSSGLSKVQIFHHTQNNTYRVVGRKLQDHEVVINCSILKGLKYNQATATFHQWRDSKYVYGLNFSSHNDAEAFARAMTHALDVLSGRVINNPGQPTNGNGNGNGYEEDMGYRTMTSEDAAILRQQQLNGQVTPSAQTPTSQTNQNNIPQSPPTPQGHHRTSRNSLSAPPATQTTGMALAQTQPTAQQQLFGPNGPTQNGLQTQQVQLPVGPQQVQTAQNQYHAPQQLQPQAHGVYTTQQVLNAGYQQGNQFQPQQTHYVISNSNPNLNIHQYSQQQQQQQQQQNQQQPLPAMPPPHQNGGPIYVSTAQTQAVHGMTSSASSNSVVYASQQQLSAGAAHAGHVPVQAGMPTAQAVAMSNGGAPPPPPPHAYGQLNGVLQESPYGQVPKPPPMMSVNTNGVGGVPMPPPLSRMNSQTAGGPVPPPPPSFGYNNNAPPPPAPPAPPSSGGGAAPPPPPPPPMGGGVNATAKDPQADLMSSLAAQLQQAKLKKKTSIAAADTNGSNAGGNYGTIGRTTTGMASMMDEMAKTLARRRAQAERKEPEPEADMKQRPWEKSNTLPHKLGSSSNSSTNSSNPNSNNTSNSGGESPRPIRKRFGSASEETILKVNGDGLSLALSGGDLDALKAEIVREMRQELNKFKQDIIDAIKSEFNRR